MLAGIVSFVAVYSTVLYGGLVEGLAAEWWTNMAWSIASLAVALRCFATAVAERALAQRRAWWLFGVAALVWFAGMVWWDYRYLIQRADFVYPYYYDVLFMIYPLFMVAGTFFYRARRLSTSLSLIQIANLGIILCTVTFGCVLVLYEPIQKTEQSDFFVGFAIFHAVLHIVAMVFALYCYWFYVWKASRPMFLLILAALALHSLADVLYTFELMGESFDAFNYLNVYWLVAFALQYIAAFEQRELNRAGVLDNPPDDTTPATGSFEALTPSLSVLALYAIALVYQDRLSASVFDVTASVGVLFALFLGLRAWWNWRYQEGLRAQLHSANQDLEARVRERTAALETAQATLVRQERFATLGQLTAIVSHELRNPLGTLRNSIALIDGLSDDCNEPLKASCMRANRSIERCDGIIEELLDFSRTREVETKPTDPGLWLERLLDEYELAPQVRLIRHVAQGITAHFDSERLRRAVINLLDNACETLSHEGSPDATVTVECRARDESLELVVSDNGPGMQPEALANLFEPLYSTKSFGVGLGMTIVKQVVELHDGDVSVSSGEGRGARVVLRLPLDGPSGVNRTVTFTPAETPRAPR